MRHSSFSFSFLSLPLACAALALSSCTTTYVTPMAVAHPKRLDLSPSQSAIAGAKVFALPHDWQYDSWVMKKGSQITFYADGTGEFDCTVFSQYTTQPDELHFQSIQYGVDGNVLFTFPGADVGHPLHIRESNKDYIYHVKFAYNRSYYPYIHDVKFHARLRWAAGTTALGYRKREYGTVSTP